MRGAWFFASRTVSVPAMLQRSPRESRRHGRNAGCPTPPVQSRTCSFPASGSSVALASAQGHTRFAIARREVGSCCAGPTCPGGGSWPGGVLPSSPAPWRGLSPPPRPRLDPPPPSPPAGVPVARSSPPASDPAPQRRAGSSLAPGPGCPCRASGALDQTPLLLMGRSVWGLPSASTPLCLPATAGGRRRTLPSSPARMVLSCLRCALHPAASATSAVSKLCQHFRGRGPPCGLQETLSTLRPSCSPCLHDSAMGARLATGGWRLLTQQGLSPCQRRQAFWAR